MKVKNFSLDNFFKLSQFDTSVRQEIIGGITTFATMLYTFAVVPGILEEAGVPLGPLTTALIIMAGLTTIAMGLFSNRPFALAPGLGSVAFFSVTLVATEGLDWETAAGMVFISGMLFILFTVLGLRRIVVNLMPLSIKLPIGAGVGLYIALIGFRNGNFVLADESANSLVLGDIASNEAILFIIGFIIMSVLLAKNVRGHLLIGIVITTIVGIPMGITELPDSFFSLPESIAPITMKLDIASALNIAYFPFILAFFIPDFFSSLGTMLGVAEKGKMLDKSGNLPNIDRPFLVDATGTTIGSFFTLPVITTYVESASGVEAGGRTGLTSVTTGFLFLLMLLVTPLIILVPTEATAPALVIVGFSMLSSVKNIDFSDVTEYMPSVVTIALTIFTFNFGNGIAAGIITYVFIKAFSGRYKEIPTGLYFVVIPLIFYFITLAD